jgi:hypothetical protein
MRPHRRQVNPSNSGQGFKPAGATNVAPEVFSLDRKENPAGFLYILAFGEREFPNAGRHIAAAFLALHDERLAA